MNRAQLSAQSYEDVQRKGVLRKKKKVRVTVPESTVFDTDSLWELFQSSKDPAGDLLDTIEYYCDLALTKISYKKQAKIERILNFLLSDLMQVLTEFHDDIRNFLASSVMKNASATAIDKETLRLQAYVAVVYETLDAIGYPPEDIIGAFVEDKMSGDDAMVRVQARIEKSRAVIKQLGTYTPPGQKNSDSKKGKSTLQSIRQSMSKMSSKMKEMSYI